MLKKSEQRKSGKSNWKDKEKERRENQSLNRALSFTSHTLSPLPCVLGMWTSVTWPCWFDFRPKPISGNIRTTQNFVTHIKSSQK